MNKQTDPTKYQQLSDELNAMLGYDVVTNLRELGSVELTNLRESLNCIDLYLNHKAIEV